MTPKEKAEELFNKYCYAIRYNEKDSEYWTNIIYAKNCALIAIDLRLDGDFIFTSIEYGEDSLEYWQEVKKEINKL